MLGIQLVGGLLVSEFCAGASRRLDPRIGGPEIQVDIDQHYQMGAIVSFDPRRPPL
jgi:hypothetical protein